MSKNTPTEILVALHVEGARSIRVSNDGDDSKGKWIPRSLIGSMHETGQTTQGTDRNGQKARIPLANLVIPEWLAVREELV